MITSLYIDNFKSLVDFFLPMSKFNCIIGLNGAGKSTLLHALDFLGHMASGKLDDWLQVREWKKTDLNSKFLRKHTLSFKLNFDFNGIGPVEWEGSYNTTLLRCTTEIVRAAGEEVLKLSDGILRVRPADTTFSGPSLSFDMKKFALQGSVFSFLKGSEFHPAVRQVQETVTNLKSLDMLSPHLMRKRARDGSDLGHGGERLAAFIHGLDKNKQKTLGRALQSFYPQVEDITTGAKRFGWKNLKIHEVYANSKILLDPRHINDGMLRILAILARLHSGKDIVLFDEIENGINPELIEKLVHELVNANQQVVVTTHSPMILNYLEDNVAVESVVLLYRTQEGYSKAVRFFDLPVQREKLEALGPGEVFVDSYLEEVVQELGKDGNDL